jgi:hypothetical protein
MPSVSPFLGSVTLEVASLFTKKITGRVLTPEQIKSITKSAVGKYFADFLPTPEAEALATSRVEAARLHVDAATKITRDRGRP